MKPLEVTKLIQHPNEIDPKQFGEFMAWFKLMCAFQFAIALILLTIYFRFLV